MTASGRADETSRESRAVLVGGSTPYGRGSQPDKWITRRQLTTGSWAGTMACVCTVGELDPVEELLEFEIVFWLVTLCTPHVNGV